MFIDSDQKRFGAYVAQTIFHHSQAFPTEKKKNFVWLFWSPKKSQRCSKKREFQKLASKTNWQPWSKAQPVHNRPHGKYYCVCWV